MRSRGALQLQERKTLANKTRTEDALQPWSADRLREGNADKKTKAEAGCTEPMAHNGSATQLRHMHGNLSSDEREEEESAGAVAPRLPH